MPQNKRPASQRLESVDEVREWILSWAERELDVPAEKIDCDTNLLNYGMDSVNAIMLIGDLEAQLNIRLKPTLMWDHPTINGLAQIVHTQRDTSSGETEDKIDASSQGDIDPASMSREEAEKWLENIEQLSDEQVSQLLERLT